MLPVDTAPIRREAEAKLRKILQEEKSLADGLVDSLEKKVLEDIRAKMNNV